ncbi:MAG TPA: hypothetical protein VFZ65_03700 [Planctomycetota bacterium]|nr:hypothetical protein [Planctomycetota bacterium]
MTDSTPNAASADFEAAMHEVETNLEVRRLMLVITNVLTPACVMAISDCLSGSDYPPALAWLPPVVLPLSGALLLGCGFLVAGVLGRCHFGLVLNGTKMRKVETGRLELQSLNWLGVTTNFVALTALSAALGAVCLAASCGGRAWAWPAAAVVAAGLMLWLPVCHWRANRRCRSLDAHWQHGLPPVELRERHARKSLDATAADISVVVVMAVALFAGVFNALTNLGGIPADLALTPAPAVLKTFGMPVLAAFLLASQLLSCRILVRLRLAFGTHSRRLAELRGEVDATAMLWRPQERTYLLYAIVLVLAAASALLFGYERFGRTLGLVLGGAVLAAGAIWYPFVLRTARRRRK